MKVKIEGSDYERVVEVAELDEPKGSELEWFNWWWGEVIPRLPSEATASGTIHGDHRATIIDAENPALINASYVFKDSQPRGRE